MKEHLGPAPELLAPAGSPEAFRAAVAAGADAVYLSGKQFGARKFAANFTEDEIASSITYAHIRGVRVYVTVNTLIHDRELAGALDWLLRLFEMGVDAVLLQDTGLAALARKIVPELPIHASTQMTIHNSEGVRWAAGHGFSRIVLARELTLPEIRKIRAETRDTGAGLEVFAHGALCYSYSGACLLSSVIGGRSGNRGMCAQPCRKPYTLVCGESDGYGRPRNLREIRLPDRYLLSPRDLCTYGGLSDLFGIVSSLKIEGRMKSPQYVAVVVSAYRKALDAIAAGTFLPEKNVLSDLALAFSRGFTKGYLLGDRHDALMARDVPDNRGLAIGTVTRSDKKSGTVLIRPCADYVPATGDGIWFSAGSGDEGWGFMLNTVPVLEKGLIRMAVPRELSTGTRVHVTFSRDLENRANRIIANPAPELLRPVQLDLDLEVRDDGSIGVRGTVCPPGREPVPFGFCPGLRMEPARSHPVTREALARQMAKTGGSPFAIRTLNLAYKGDRFAPVAAINKVRRELLDAAENALGAASRPAPDAVAKARMTWKMIRGEYALPCAAHTPQVNLNLSVYTDTREGVRAAAGAGADTVCFEPDTVMPVHRCGPAALQPSVQELVREALAICRNAGITLAWKFPRITRDAELDVLLPQLRSLAADGLDACMAEHPGTAAAIISAAPGIRLLGGPHLNIFNHAAVHAAKEQFSILTLSSELSGTEIAALTACAHARGTHPALAMVVHGSAEAMITDDCIRRLVPGACPGQGNGSKTAMSPFIGIQDETGRIFPVTADGTCRTRIGNAAELCLLDHLPVIRNAGITHVAIDCRGKPAAYTADMTRLYRAAVDIANKGLPAGNRSELGALREQAKKLSHGGITAGHFLRGLAE